MNYVVEFPCDFSFSAGEVTIAVGISSFERTLVYREELAQVSIADVADGEQPIRASGAAFTSAQVITLGLKVLLPSLQPSSKRFDFCRT